MARAHQYRNALLADDSWVEVWNDDQVRVGGLSLTTLAEHLQVGQSSIILDDPDADLGHGGETILGHHRFELIESDAVDDEHVVITFIGERKFRRGGPDRPSLRVGAKREIELSLYDLNAIPSFVVIDPDDPEAKRPRESVDERLAWLLASDYLLGRVHDDGVVESNTTMMDAAEYGGQTAANVIGDCELAAGFGWNAWIYYLEDAGHYSLGFINANTSTLYSSDLRISNLLSDIDTLTVADFETGTTFAPLYDSELTKDPTNLVSGVHVPYKNSHVFRERAATKSIYGPREQSAPNSNVRSRTAARRMADDFLFQHRNDADNIHVAIEVPTSKANAIKAGHRLQVKFTHLPGYEGFTWCRVIRRTIIQEQATDRYIIDMDLSPQEQPCVDNVLPTFTQSANTAVADYVAINSGESYAYTFSLDAPSVIGNLIIAHTASSRAHDDPAVSTPPGWNWLVQNVLTAGQYQNIFWKVSDGEQDITVRFGDNKEFKQCMFAEYAGMNNPTVYDYATLVSNEPTYDGCIALPACDYPAGPTAVIAIGCSDDAPEPSGVTTEPAALVLRDAGVNGGLDVPTQMIGDMLLDVDEPSGTTVPYTGPGSGGWRFLFLGNLGTQFGAVISFGGESCV